MKYDKYTGEQKTTAIQRLRAIVARIETLPDNAKVKFSITIGSMLPDEPGPFSITWSNGNK